MQYPDWKKNAVAFFAKHYDNSAGSPKRIALACCEVAAYLAGTDVDVNAAQNGLVAGVLIHQGKQPFENEGIIIDTNRPHDALTIEKTIEHMAIPQEKITEKRLQSDLFGMKKEESKRLSPESLAAVLTDD